MADEPPLTTRGSSFGRVRRHYSSARRSVPTGEGRSLEFLSDSRRNDTAMTPRLRDSPRDEDAQATGKPLTRGLSGDSHVVATWSLST